MRNLQNFILEGMGREMAPVMEGSSNFVYENLESHMSQVVQEALIEFGQNNKEKQFGQVIVFAGGAGCYPHDTEFFNGKGWQKISEYKEGDSVLIFDKETGESKLSSKVDYVDLPLDSFYKIKTVDNSSFVTSENHKHLLLDNEGKFTRDYTTKEILEVFPFNVFEKSLYSILDINSCNSPTQSDMIVGIEKLEKQENERMYCFTTETGYFVVRQNGKIYVSGNSGKGFILKNMLGNKGIVLDVDYFKEVAPRVSFIVNGIRELFGVEVSELDLKNPQHVSDLHMYLGKHGLDLKNRKFSMIFNSVMLAHKDRKPNVIFDMTMKEMEDIEEVRSAMEPLGYDPKNINVIWVINSIEKAIEQNLSRGRRVDTNLLINIHHGVANTMKNLIHDKANRLPFDGEMWLVFNKEGVDNFYKSTEKKGGFSEYLFGKKSAGGYFDYVTNIRIKERGKAIDPNKLDREMRAKLSEYTEVNF